MRNTKFILYFLISILYSEISFSQVWNISFSKKMKDEYFDRSELNVPLFKVSGDSMQTGGTSPSDVSVFHKIKFPDLTNCTDTAYTYLYFNGAKDGKISGFIPVIVANYTYKKPMKWFVDANVDFDFSNDSNAITVSRDLFPFEIKLSNSTSKNDYTIRLTRMTYRNKMSYWSMLNEYYKAQYPLRKFMGPDLCFREQRYLLKGADFKSENDSFCMALYDGDVDGNFSSGEDKFFITNCGADSVNTEAALVSIPFEKDKNSFEFIRNGKKYLLQLKNNTENEAVLKVLSTMDYIGLQPNRKIPKFKFKTIKNEYKKIKKFRCKEVILYFTDLKNPSFTEDTTALSAIYNQFGKKVIIVLLYYGKSPSSLKNFVQFSEAKYFCGYSNNIINKKMLIEKIPLTIYCGKHLKLKKYGTAPKEILELLQSSK